MLNTKKKIKLYFITVIIPTILVSIAIATINYNYMSLKQKNEIKLAATDYKNTLDIFINHTTSNLNILSTVISITNSTEQEIESLLSNIPKDESHFSNYYFSDSAGNISIASHPLTSPVSIADRDYFKELFIRKDIVFSSLLTERFYKQKSLVVATPVFVTDSQITGLVVATLNINKMATDLNNLSIRYPFSITDSYGTEIISPISKHNTAYERIIAFENTKWILTLYYDEITVKTVIFSSLPLIVAFIILIHIIYLLILYQKLKHQSKEDRKTYNRRKLELIGTLAASTAHEIKNPLTGIQGFVSLLSEKHKDEEDQFYFSIIKEEINRINDIASEFLILGKPIAFKKERCNVKEVIEETLPIIQSEAALYQITTNILLTKDDTTFTCTTDHIKQLVLNLCKNGLEAMNAGGQLTISLERNSTHISIVIQDIGQGIPKELETSIFEPFFTSKDTGTGLGLFVCKRIVDTYDGTFQVESKEGIGTKITVLFPIHQVNK